MTFLVILCEGETEMDFVRDMLRDHLLLHGVQVHAILFGKKVQKDVASAPGGVLKYEPVLRHIEATMRQYRAPSSRVTTMLDIGVHHLKATCPHFANWLSTLEGLGAGAG